MFRRELSSLPPLILYNTLTRRKEGFKPLFGRSVKLYNCGPTVYNFAHVGNLRAYVFADLLRRTLQWNNYKVRQVINITDVGHLTSDADEGEDKITAAAAKEHKNASEIAEFYTQAFFNDLDRLNIARTDVLFPRASRYIREQIELVKKLEVRGFIYRTSDGIYFDTSKFEGYGKLGGIDLSGLEEGKRIGVNPEKKNPTDFALWKFSQKGEERQQEWSSPWGVGFPGWHLECSAMAMKLLGETIDIHTGGIDHIPIHHNNEIAQSEAATRKPFARFWMHNAFLTVGGSKMAKSKGNLVNLLTLIENGITPLAFRYWLLTALYRTPMNLTWDALGGAERAYEKLLSLIHALGPFSGIVSEQYLNNFSSAVNDDLNTPKALALIWDLLRDESVSSADKRATIAEADEILGLNLEHEAARLSEARRQVPEEVKRLVHEREVARRKKDWKRSDILRIEIEHLGYSIHDSAEGTIVERKITLAE